MAYQDDRLPSFVKHNVTEVYRDLDKFQTRVKELKKRAVVVMRGLPGTGKTKIAEELQTGKVIKLTDFFDDNMEGNKKAYTIDNVKKAHIAMRKHLKYLFLNPKMNDVVIIVAPHVYMWELKYYKAITNQMNVPFIIYECRTLFSKDNKVRFEQLKDVNVGNTVTEITEWLKGQKPNDLLPAQKELLNVLLSPNPIDKAKTQKASNNSFCPTVLLNIQYATWLTRRCEHNIFMDVIYHYMMEWNEIIDEATMYKCNTPRWGW